MCIHIQQRVLPNFQSACMVNVDCTSGKGLYVFAYYSIHKVSLNQCSHSLRSVVKVVPKRIFRDMEVCESIAIVHTKVSQWFAKVLL